MHPVDLPGVNQGINQRQPGIPENFIPPFRRLVSPDLPCRQIGQQEGNPGEVKVVYRLIISASTDIRQSMHPVICSREIPLRQGADVRQIHPPYLIHSWPQGLESLEAVVGQKVKVAPRTLVAQPS